MIDKLREGETRSDGVEAEIRRQQQIFLVNQVPTMTVVNLTNGSFVAAYFWIQNPSVGIVMWYLALAASALVQFQGWWRIRNQPPPDKVSGKSLERAKTVSLLAGAVWGSTVLVLYPADSVPQQMFLAVVLAGMTAGLTSILNPLPSLCSRFVLAALVPLIVRLVMDGTAIHVIVAAMAAIFIVALINGSRKAFKQFSDMVRFSHELETTRADLVDALESTKDGFAMFDRDGRVVLANRRFQNWFPDRTDLASIDTGESLTKVSGGDWVRHTLRPTSRGGYVSVHTDVTELKEREEQLLTATRQAEEARTRAEEANRAKSQFLANMSHELRTPLNAIIGFSEIMRDEMFGDIGSPQYKGYSSDIHMSASHLLSIISDILDLSKIESSSYEIEPEVINAREILAWVANLCQNQHKVSEGRTVELHVAPDFGDLDVDERAFKQVVLNLVNNALKFTPPEGRVGISARVSLSGEPQITVWDTGIGIPADKVDWVLQPFHQVEGAFQRKYQGTGLGLSISNALIAMHGGRIEIESKEEIGTSVHVYLPRERHIAANAPAQTAAHIARAGRPH